MRRQKRSEQPSPAVNTEFKFDPDKMVDNDTFTNGQRAIRGEAAVRLSPDSKRAEAGDTEPSDIIADILHFCDMMGFNGDEVLSRAEMHWRAER